MTAAADTARLGAELAEICSLEAARGREAPHRPRRALAFGRFKAADVRSILEAGPGVPEVTEPGEALVLEMPVVPTRSPDDYRLEALG